MLNEGLKMIRDRQVLDQFLDSIANLLERLVPAENTSGCKNDAHFR